MKKWTKYQGAMFSDNGDFMKKFEMRQSIQWYWKN